MSLRKGEGFFHFQDFKEPLRQDEYPTSEEIERANKSLSQESSFVERFGPGIAAVLGFATFAVPSSVQASQTIIYERPASTQETPNFDGAVVENVNFPEKRTVVSKEQYFNRFREQILRTNRGVFIGNFKNLMNATARINVLDNGTWIVPSRNYDFYFFSRDSFWLLASLEDRGLSQMAIDRFREDQKYNGDGHIASALYKDGFRGETRDRDDESTMFYVLSSLVLKRLGGNVDKGSLERAFGFINSHVQNGRYVTFGERRTGPAFEGDGQLGTYHYWADTFRPSGRRAATPEVIAYNQGLYCVSLRALGEMGVGVDPNVLNLAERNYSQMVNVEDHVSLPQREGSTIMDVSSLTPEALSLYFFDHAILSDKRVSATINNLTPVYYRDGRFLGFKIISDYYGPDRPGNEFIVPSSNTPGNYQRGGSWELYDALALYASARHGNIFAYELLMQRMESEVRNSWSSHEFISTNPRSLGASEAYRNGYGWNSFTFRLIP